jgi:hypothetical protein
MLTIRPPMPAQEALVCDWRANHAQLGALPHIRNETLQSLNVQQQQRHMHKSAGTPYSFQVTRSGIQADHRTECATEIGAAQYRRSTLHSTGWLWAGEALPSRVFQRAAASAPHTPCCPAAGPPTPSRARCQLCRCAQQPCLQHAHTHTHTHPHTHTHVAHTPQHKCMCFRILLPTLRCQQSDEHAGVVPSLHTTCDVQHTHLQAAASQGVAVPSDRCQPSYSDVTILCPGVSGQWTAAGCNIPGGASCGSNCVGMLAMHTLSGSSRLLQSLTTRWWQSRSGDRPVASMPRCMCRKDGHCSNKQTAAQCRR